MIGFLIKKVFFDIWDNMLRLVFLSVVYIFTLVLFYFSGMVGESSTILSLLILLSDVLLFSLYSLGVSGITKCYSDYHAKGFLAFKEAIKYHWKHAILHFGLCCIIGLIYIYLIPFYFAINSFIGLLLGMLMFWISIVLILAMQYFYPLCMTMEGDGPFKTFKKCLILTADNFGASIFLLIRTILDFALTVLTASLVTGLAGISLSRMDTVKLIMKKYDYLEANPGATKKDINWEDLLYEERELVGPRSLKGMLFPWKD